MFRMMAVQVQQQPSEQRLPVLLTVRNRLMATHAKQQRRLIRLSSQMCNVSTNCCYRQLIAAFTAIVSHCTVRFDDPKDLLYEPNGSQSTMSTSQSSVSVVSDRKFIVFDSQLDKLLCHLVCPICQCPCSIDDVVKKYNEGTLLHVVARCIEGHIIVDWQSQPLIGRMPAGNLLFCAATLFIGQTFAHMQNVATFLNLHFLSHTPFYDIQCTNLMPVIMEASKTQQQSLFAELRCNGKPLRLCGDGRMDSPGFSAKYCCYTLMDMDTDKVIAFAVVDVSAARGISTNMKVLVFEHCLQELLDNGFTVDVIATGRHVQVRSLLKNKYPTISLMCGMLQNLSVKNVDTDLSQRSWSVCNHLRWSAANCNCDSDMLEETWRCVVHHIVNVHEFEGDVFTKCGHPPLTDDGQSRKKWLTPQSPAHNALKEVVLNKTLLKDIRQLNEFCHTGSLEVYHSLMAKYCPKRLPQSHDHVLS